MSTASAEAEHSPLIATDDAVTVFVGMGPEHAHPADAPGLSRDFFDPGACLMCRAGWCVQRLTVTPGQTSATVRHGLIIH